MRFDRTFPRAVGEQKFNLEECKFNGPFFVEGFSEYIPLAAIIGNNTHSLSMSFSKNAWYSQSGDMKKKRKLAHLFHERVATSITDSGIYRVSKANISSGEGTLTDLMYAYKNAINNFLKKECGFELERSPVAYKRATYVNLIQTIFGGEFNTYYFQSIKTVSVGPGFVYSHILNDFLFCLVVPEELIHYQRLYFILNGEFDAKGTQFWVRSNFDTPKTEFKSFRSIYRKQVKVKMEEWNVPFVKKVKIIDELVPTLSIPSELNEIEEWKATIARETLLQEREKLEFNFS